MTDDEITEMREEALVALASWRPCAEAATVSPIAPTAVTPPPSATSGGVLECPSRDIGSTEQER